MEYQLFIQVYFVIYIYGFHKPVNSISVPVLSHLRSWHLSLENMYYTWVILNLNLHAISWARWLLIDGRVSPSISPCWITSFFSFCESLRESYCVYSRHPNPQMCLPSVPFLVCSPSFSSYLHPPSSSCCCSVSDHPSTAMDTKFVHRLFIWYRYLFPLPNTDYLIFCTFLHFWFWTEQTHLLFPSQS